MMGLDEDLKFWNETWTVALTASPVSPDAPTWRNDIDRLKIEFLQQYLPKTGSVVELGCGSARLLARIGRAVPLQLIGLDASIPALQLAEATATTFGVTIQRVCSDINPLPFPDASFALVASGGLLEHFPNPVPLLAEMIRILRPGGVLYADIVPRKFSLHRPSYRRRATNVYRSNFGPTEYRQWLNDLGCSDITMQSVGVYPPLLQAYPTRIRRVIDQASRSLNGTPIADALGWLFMFAARRTS